MEKRLDSKAESRQELSEIRDEFLKPEEIRFPDFSPRNVILRERTFPDGQILVKINIIQKQTGYTDTKEEVENLESFEKSGEFTLKE